MTVTPSHCRVFLLVVGWLFACRQAGEVETLVASAEKARHEGQLELAADLYHRAAELKPHDVEVHYRAALLDVQAGKMREAEGHLRTVLSRRSDVAAAHLNLGVVLVNRGQEEEGRKEFLEALRLDPRLTRAYYNLGGLS